MKKYIQAFSLITLVAAAFISPVQAAGMSKSSGSTTPYNGDFSASALQYAHQGNKYNDSNQNRMFRETFRIKKCKVRKAFFQIRLKRLGAQDTNDALHLVSNQQSYFTVHPLWTNPGPSSRTINYNFPPAALQKISNGRFSFMVQDDTKVLSASLKYECGGGNNNNKKGMTWGKKGVHAVTGVLTVGCKTNGYNCKPSTGDQLCTTKLPMLCKRELNLPKPASLANGNKYTRWTGNIVGTTNPVAPALSGINTRSKANLHCRNEFGNGWKVAGFHDGWGWNHNNYGNVGKKGKRFWVNIKDKPNGNCWSQQ